MRTYHRLADEDRWQLYALCKVGKAQAEGSQALWICGGTLSRGLVWNAGQ